MHKVEHKLIALFLLMSICIETIGYTKSVRAQSSENSDLDIVVVIDNSGSMHSADGSDKLGLRYEATKMLIDLVTENDRIGVVHFSDDARVIGDKMYRMSNDDRPKLRKELDSISVDYTIKDTRPTTEDGWIKNDINVIPSGTKYEKAFDATQRFLQNSKQSNKQAVIFLTDGAPDDWRTSEDISAKVQEKVAQMNVPVFLLVLNNKNYKSKIEIEATKKAFTKANQHVVTIDSANDIAKALAGVITQLQPGTYLDVLDGHDGTGNNTTAYTTGATPDQQIKQATFVFASNSDKKDLSINSKHIPDGVNEQKGDSKRFRTFDYKVNGKIDGKWEFSANALQNTITNFVFIRTELRMQLRYPAAIGQVFAYPRNAQKVLIGATIDGLNPTSFGDVKVGDAKSCAPNDLLQATYKSTSPNGLSRNDEPLFWNTFSGRDTPLFAVVEFHPMNSLALRRCYELQPTEQNIPFRMTKPVTEKLDTNIHGNIDVVVQIPVAEGLVITPTMVFDQPPISIDNTSIDNTQQVFMHGDGGELTAELPVTYGGTHILRVVALGKYNERPIAFYAEQQVTPTVSCVYEFDRPVATTQDAQSSSELNTLWMGVITDTQIINNTIICKARFADNSTPSFDLSKAQLTNNENGNTDSLPKDMLEIKPSENRNADGFARWPMTLRNISSLLPGTYTIQVPTNEAGKSLNIIFNRPASQILLTKSDYSEINQSGLQFGNAFDALNLTQSQCVNFKPIMASESKIKPQLAVTQLSNRQTGKKSTSLIDAQLVPDSACNGGMRLVITIDESLVAGNYDIQLVGQTSDPHVPLNPNPLNVAFNKQDAMVKIVFPEHQRVQDVPNAYTYMLTKPVWPISIWPISFLGNADIPYTATVTYDNNMPGITNPAVVQVADVTKPDLRNSDTYYFKWANNYPDGNVANQFHGLLMMDEFPRLRWPGSTYDVRLQIEDPRVISPKQVIMRVETYGWWYVIGFLLLLLFLSLLIHRLYINLTKAYSGAVRFTFDDLSSDKFDLRRFKNNPVSIVRPINGGIDTLRAMLASEVPDGYDVVARIQAVNREKINVRVMSEQLNPDGVNAREVMLGKGRQIGESLRVTYSRVK